MAPVRVGNAERRRWRDKCRARLSEHVGQKLGITVQPAQIRLLPRHDDLYCWKWLPGKSYLFSKNLSDHSTGAYKELYKGVGVTFEAAPAEHLTEKPFTSPDARLSVNSKDPELSFSKIIEALREENSKLVKDLNDCRGRVSIESEQRHHAEEQVRQLKETKAELERRMHHRSVTAAYFNPRLTKILQMLEELKGEVPSEECALPLAAPA